MQDNTTESLSSFLPSDLSKTSFGIKVVESFSQKSHTYFNYQNWITDNLIIGSYISPSFNNNIDIIYGMNIGYGLFFDNTFLKGIIYSIGYHRKKFSTYNLKLSNFCFHPMIKINDNNWLLLNFNYLFNGKGDIEEKNYFEINYVRQIQNKFNINLLFKVYKENNDLILNHGIGLYYSL